MICNGIGTMMWGVLNFLLSLLLIFLFVLAVTAGVKWLWGQRPLFITGNGESALDILKRRYARGEIGREEFDSIKKILNEFWRWDGKEISFICVNRNSLDPF
ncbi:MAG: SHOCT domain-containing protein [Nitrospirales bacterium]